MSRNQRALSLKRTIPNFAFPYPEFGEYDQLIRLDRIPTVVRETILEVTDKEFPAFRQYLQRDIERYREPKQ